MHQRQQLGLKGEQAAVRYLNTKGYRILEQRYRAAQGEIDIIAAHNRTLVFIEVKTRRSTNYGIPAESVTSAKQEKIRKTALAYIQNGNHKYQGFRFDVISLLLKPDGSFLIEHIENAF